MDDSQSLLLLEELIKEVYLPLLQQQSPGQSKITDALRNEFIGNVQKFATQITHTIQQVNGDIRLNIPNIKIRDVNQAAEDTQLVARIEDAVEEWNPLIASLTEREINKQPKGNGPMAEIEFWRARNAVYNTLYEQLNNPLLKKMLDVLEVANANR
ncbi:flagellar inner arm dynein 1 heavy chain alpha [Planoprotostelium fungivorum]|uniref:Flagellar inner arm dynein 1 heavy chain alpha n=1 Tax=Planoprotostelium fungivorum TaxID=1890364 RepID=A0A2P6N6G6_9EUKA|nr:flagellar inner arm dynein 1 heavy chain alpha [Planoprotostelium fungivorum]